MSKDGVKVAVRVRPFNQREKELRSQCIISVEGNSTTIRNPETLEKKTFSYDHSYWSHDGYIADDQGILHPDSPYSNYASQSTVFEDLGQGVLDNAWEGYNAALFAYGQTGSGKSYSMIGYGANKGIVPITCDQLFKGISNKAGQDKQYQVTYSMFEIYNEKVRDLLVISPKNAKTQGSMKIRHHPKSGFYVEGLKNVPVENYRDIERLMNQGTLNRTTASTNMNATSSRSHMVVTINFKQVFKNDIGQSTTKLSKINLVDLAGSERAVATGAIGDRLKEGSAINRSLLMLGNVISALAENASGKKKMVPYRDSVLTMLLQSALGGNSKTVMIAALSPAAINYEETLSTLKYADRAKKIQNKAVINESPTDRLIRELKEENSHLKKQMMQMASGKGGIDEKELKDIEMLLEENERQLKNLNLSWEQRLTEAKKEWEKSVRSQKVDEENWTILPHISNINEDSQLSGVMKYCMDIGITILGKSADSSVTYQLKGLGIQNQHAIFENSGKHVSITPVDSKSEIMVNGKSIKNKTYLQHSDRIKLGSNNLYLFIGFPSERTDTEIYDYEFFQNEIGEGSGLSLLSREKDEGLDPETLLVLQDYINLLPQIHEANTISEELQRRVMFELEVKNLASHDSLGRPKSKEVLIRVTDQATNKIWMWSKEKFINRKYLMQDIYEMWLEGENIDIEKNRDPFWDPIEPIFIGSCHAWLNSLAYCMDFDDHIEICNYHGRYEGIMHVKLLPCDSKGNALDTMGNDTVLDPNELLGQKLNFIVSIPECLEVKWVLEDNSRGIQCRFNMYNEPQLIKTQIVWNSGNPEINFHQMFTVNKITKDYLKHLESHAIVIEVWGAQVEHDNEESEEGILASQLFRETSIINHSKTIKHLKEKLKDKEKEIKQLRTLQRHKSQSKTTSTTPTAIERVKNQPKPLLSHRSSRPSKTNLRLSSARSDHGSLDPTGFYQGCNRDLISSSKMALTFTKTLPGKKISTDGQAGSPTRRKAIAGFTLGYPASTVGLETEHYENFIHSPNPSEPMLSMEGKNRIMRVVPNGTPVQMSTPTASRNERHQSTARVSHMEERHQSRTEDSSKIDLEIFKAIRSFFRDIKGVQNQMQTLKEIGKEIENAGQNCSIHKLFEEQQIEIGAISDQLNSCVKQLRESTKKTISKAKFL